MHVPPFAQIHADAVRAGGAAARMLRRQPLLAPIGLSAAAVALTIHSAFANTNLATHDYGLDAKPAVDALSRLDLTAYAHAAPLMGSFSLILRAPFVALTRAAGGGTALTYTVGAIACMLPMAALAVWLLRQMRSRAASTRVAVAALFALCPFAGAAITWGHPEEILTGTLCVAAVLLTARGRVGWGAVALGLAIATKQWALVAIAPVLVATPRRRFGVLLVAGAIVTLLTLPAALADTQAFGSSARAIASVHSWVSVTSAWWPLANVHHLVVSDGVGLVHATTYRLPASLNLIPHALIVAVGLPLAAILLARAQRATLDQVLSLLALILLLRCVLDPWDNLYYQLPLMLALYARDALCTRGLPLASIFATVGCWAIFWHFAGPTRFASTFALYMAWSIALGSWLLVRAFELRLPRTLSVQLAGPRRTGRRAQAA